jgi:hypothetical protein
MKIGLATDAPLMEGALELDELVLGVLALESAELSLLAPRIAALLLPLDELGLPTSTAELLEPEVLILILPASSAELFELSMLWLCSSSLWLLPSSLSVVELELLVVEVELELAVLGIVLSLASVACVLAAVVSEPSSAPFDSAEASLSVVSTVEAPHKFAHRLGSDVLEASSGCETPSVHCTTGFVSISHSQQGSPSSWPFVWPSPSVSASHSSLVHLLPAAENSSPKVFVAADLPVPSGCPIAGTSGTLPPLGIIFTNFFEASASEVSSAVSASAQASRVEQALVIFMNAEGGIACWGEGEQQLLGVRVLRSECPRIAVQRLPRGLAMLDEQKQTFWWSTARVLVSSGVSCYVSSLLAPFRMALESNLPAPAPRCFKSNLLEIESSKEHAPR